jgi:hypothetical protein
LSLIGAKGFILPAPIGSILTSLFFREVKDLFVNNVVSIFILFRETKVVKNDISEDISLLPEETPIIPPRELERKLPFATGVRLFESKLLEKYEYDIPKRITNVDITKNLLYLFFILF